MARAFALIVLVSACSGSAEPAGEATNGESTTTAPEAAPAPRGEVPLELPSEAAEGLAILERMSEWCSGSDDCDVSERPEAYPQRAAAGETNGYIGSHRELAAEHGVVAVWDPGRMRFVSQVEHDVRLIIGGHFSPDHLSPEVHAAVLARAQARPSLYLGVLVNRVLERDPGWLSSMHLPALPRLVADAAPEDTRAVAGALLAIHRWAATTADPPPADDEHRLDRLRDRIRTLEALAE